MRGYFGLPKNTLFQLNEGSSELILLNKLGILPDPRTVNLSGAFARLDVTSDDLSFSVNGIHIIRVQNDQLDNLPVKLANTEVAERFVQAGSGYSNAKVSKLLNYVPGTDYRLKEIHTAQESTSKFNPYYAYYQVMKMSEDEFALRVKNLDNNITHQAILDRKKEFLNQIYKDNGISNIELSKGYGFKRLKREIEFGSGPLVKALKGRAPGNIIEIMVDNIAQRYTPESADSVYKSAEKIASIFGEIYSKAKRYGVLMPKDQQLLTFFGQIAERVFGESHTPLSMFIVTCPRYSQEDELSETANAYLHALPIITTILTKNDIPYKGYILVDDAEEHVAGGLYLSRLGLTKETYKDQCVRNVDVVKKAIIEDNRLVQVSAHLFSDIFPDFTKVTANLERRLYQLSQNDPELRLSMAKVADARLPRHTKILNGQCDFSDSLYLAIHYSAEYMALGYLCRIYSELNGDNFIVNYNSPNVGQFNNTDLLVSCIKGDTLADKLVNIPTFQVKLY